MKSFLFAGARTIAMQLMEINSAITSDLGSFLYHLLGKLDQEDDPWGRTELSCQDPNPPGSNSFSQMSDIMYLKALPDPDTPQELCNSYNKKGGTNCLESVEKVCSEIPGRCNEGVANLLTGDSKVK